MEKISKKYAALVLLKQKCVDKKWKMTPGAGKNIGARNEFGAPDLVRR